MKHELDKMMGLIKDYKTGYGGVTDSFMRKELEMFAKDYHSEQCNIGSVSKRLLAEKIILALDDYGREVHPVQYGLPIDPDTKDFEDEEPQEMLKIVTDILNGC